MKGFVILALSLCCISSALAQDDTFGDGKAGAKVHEASGFVCPVKIGRFERDAVGVRSTETDADYCAYAARDGVYGTIVLSPLPSEFDPKAQMAQDFVVMEGVGSRQIDEKNETFGPGKTISAYVRTYETARIEAMHYRVDFVCAAVGSWSVQVTMEYADPRDTETKDDFLRSVYDMAAEKLSGDN